MPDPNYPPPPDRGRPRSRKRHYRCPGGDGPRSPGKPAAVLLANLPVALRALRDHVLTGRATAQDVAYRIGSTINAIEAGQTPSGPPTY